MLNSRRTLVTIGGRSPIKNLIAGAIGALLATVGIDLMISVEQYTFGIPELTDGIDFVPAIIGVFGISVFLVQKSRANASREHIALKAIQLPTRRDYQEVWTTILRSSGIGSFIGILPAEGATVASMIGCNEARRWSKTPEKFGKGAIEGSAGSEAANNAATGDAMVPILARGVPGSPTAAVILAGLMVHRVRRKPTMITDPAEFAFAIFWSMMLVNLLFLAVRPSGIRAWRGSRCFRFRSCGRACSCSPTPPPTRSTSRLRMSGLH